MSAVRVCPVTDVECRRDCNTSCKQTSFAGAATTATTGIQQHLTIKSIEAAMEKLRGLPPAKWLLVSPDGRMFSDEDPMKLAQVLAQAKYGLWPPAPQEDDKP